MMDFWFELVFPVLGVALIVVFTVFLVIATAALFICKDCRRGK